MNRHNLTDENIQEIINLYKSKEMSSTHRLAQKYKVTHKTISKILKDNHVSINSKGGQLKYGRELTVQRYLDSNRKDGTTLIAVCKISGKRFNDYSNISGALSSHIKENYSNIAIPSSYKRRMIFKSTGKYWHEDYFDIIDIDKCDMFKCKYCDWETIDITNKSGAYVNHLLKVHNKTINDYLQDFPDDVYLFRVYQKEKFRESTITYPNDYVICQICGKKMKSINNKHLQTHNITPDEYKLRYSTKLLSNSLTITTSKRLKQYNEINRKDRFVSKSEHEINDIIKECGFNTLSNDRKILKGKEIDIIIPELKLGIEFNGNKFHTEYFGDKYPNYHLDKLIECNKNGYNLIQIFEDEWELNREIVINKILYLIGKSKGKKIGARNCIIRPILTYDKNIFLNSYHIQGEDTSSIKLGAFYNDILVGVMTFKPITSIEFELNRFATNYNYIVSGLGTKMLKYFIKVYNPKKIISFADRRWTLSNDDNLYTKMGFSLCSITKPDYKYYNTKIHRYKRFHKFQFRKKNLHEKYGLPMTLTEKEMTTQLGYDRIWDCGLLKYELKL